MRLVIAIVLVLGVHGLGVGGNALAAPARQTPVVGGGCDGCALMFEAMPAALRWETAIADSAEAGEPMEIGGTIYQRDGKTPANGVILYVYHTDARGFYSPAQGQTLAKRHGHLRGWMRTGADGHYRFKTIRPAPYPNARIPAHIHPLIKEADKNEYWIDEYVFEDDKLLTQSERQKRENRGGSGVITLTKNVSGVWIGHRDIVLGLKIPNYPLQ